jgi:hypothetical protein
MNKRISHIKSKILTILFSDYFFLGVLSLFIFINWILMIRQDILACNDYYQYYLAQEKLFSGNLNLEFIPPLFPFLLGLSGRFIKLFGGTVDHFILGGQIISLFSGFGVLFFSYKLLKKYAPGFAIIGTIFLSVSPFFLKLISTAQTDMLYLCFTAALFYFFSQEKKTIHTIVFTTAGLLTRFEGVLLVGSCLLNTIDLKKKSWKYLLLSAIPAGFILYLSFDRFAHRLIDKIALIISKQYFFYYFSHPGELVHLLYGNFLYFVPHKSPPPVKWFLLYILLGLFFTGCYYLYKTKKKWLLSASFYLFFFIIAKGYTLNLNPEMEFRRWLSFIWLFFIIVLAGICFLWQKIKEREKINIPVKMAFALFCLQVLFLPVIKGTSTGIALLLLLPALLYGVKKTAARMGKYEFAGWFLLLVIFFSQVYYDGLKRTFFYLDRDSNAGSYMVANWLNGRPAKEKILVYAFTPMYRYYVEKGKIRGAITIAKKEIYNDREKLTIEFMKRLKKQKIKYIAFDGYRSPAYKARNAIKDFLYTERDKGIYFKIKKHLYYKGKYVASVLMPNNR